MSEKEWGVCGRCGKEVRMVEGSVHTCSPQRCVDIKDKCDKLEAENKELKEHFNNWPLDKRKAVEVENGRLVKELRFKNGEIARLKQGICEHVATDEIRDGCKLCELAVAEKTAEVWVKKGKRLTEALEIYGEHNKYCNALADMYAECGCGLEQALKGE